MGGVAPECETTPKRDGTAHRYVMNERHSVQPGETTRLRPERGPVPPDAPTSRPRPHYQVHGSEE